MRTVTVGRVVIPGLIALVVAVLVRGLGPSVVAADVHVLEERKRRIRTSGLIGSMAGRRDRTIREDRADAAAAENVSLDPEDREVRRRGSGDFVIARLDVQRANSEAAGLAGDPLPDINRDLAAIVQPDAAT